MPRKPKIEEPKIEDPKPEDVTKPDETVKAEPTAEDVPQAEDPTIALTEALAKAERARDFFRGELNRIKTSLGRGEDPFDHGAITTSRLPDPAVTAKLEAQAKEIADLRGKLGVKTPPPSTPASVSPAPQRPVPTATPTPPSRPLGALQAASGVFVLGDAQSVDTHWRNNQVTRSRLGVDFKGPNAEYLSKRSQSPERVTLSDGTIRVLCGNQQMAAGIEHGAKQWMATHEADLPTEQRTSVAVRALDSSSVLCLDAARAQGAGFVTDSGATPWFAVQAPNGVEVGVQESSGRITAIILRIRP